MNTKERNKRFLLLQINDALFPIGAYSHSYGLETYIQKNLVTNTEESWNYIRPRLLYGFCCNELLSARLAYQLAEEGKLGEILKLEEELEVMRLPKETREAGRKLGSRFVKTVRQLGIPYESYLFDLYCRERAGRSMTHSIVYGVFCQAAGIPYEDAMEHYLYAQTSSMVTNCVKTIPLSQSDGQILLYRSQALYEEILRKLETLTKEDLCLSAPGFDIRCMQHEGLYSRLYMS